ncbi:Hypothetical predicted protein, partial [Pelobates cultripes]
LAANTDGTPENYPTTPSHTRRNTTSYTLTPPWQITGTRRTHKLLLQDNDHNPNPISGQNL